MFLSSENHQWLDDFRKRHGRAPRILHIGNIANNAYNNVRLLNEAGLDCDVICYDYYHVMGCPEWEDADFSGDYGDQFRPDWTAAGIRNFERPVWFAQGPLRACTEYLLAKRTGKTREAAILWSNLAVLNGSSLRKAGGLLKMLSSQWVRGRDSLRKLSHTLQTILEGRGITSKVARACDEGAIASLTRKEIFRLALAWNLLTFSLLLRTVGFPFVFLVRKLRERRYDNSFDLIVTKLVAKFAEVFPSRKDSLTVSDLEMYRQVIPNWSHLFETYDIVQAYATDPILPLLAAKKPYIGFEHGTLRSHTQCNEPICRLTSLAYHLADHVFITNGDCIDYARKIGVTQFTAMLHPVDERRIAAIAGKDLRRELGVKHVFLCTLRHDWAIKGTDQYIRALPDLVKALGRDFRVIMTRWGTELERSIALAESLGVGELIVWSEPLPRRRLIQTLKSVDVLFDQLALPHFGATAPEGIAAGVPVIMSYDPASTEWLVAEPAPILSARTSAEIVERVLQALNAEWLADYRRRAASWFNAHHSSRLVVQGHFDAYRKLISVH